MYLEKVWILNEFIIIKRFSQKNQDNSLNLFNQGSTLYEIIYRRHSNR